MSNHTRDILVVTVKVHGVRNVHDIWRVDIKPTQLLKCAVTVQVVAAQDVAFDLLLQDANKIGSLALEKELFLIVNTRFSDNLCLAQEQLGTRVTGLPATVGSSICSKRKVRVDSVKHHPRIKF